LDDAFYFDLVGDFVAFGVVGIEVVYCIGDCIVFCMILEVIFDGYCLVWEIDGFDLVCALLFDCEREVLNIEFVVFGSGWWVVF